jgi:cytochrome c oxidase assembly protein subunit 19
MVDAFGGSRANARPPERGIFPLDHDGECKAPMIEFLACLKRNNSEHNSCRELSKMYLACRMDHELMAKDDFSNLGLGDSKSYSRVATNEGEKESKGFVAGIGVKGGSKMFKR